MGEKWIIEYYPDRAWKQKPKQAEFWCMEDTLTFAIQGARNETVWGARITSPKGDHGDLSHDVLTGNIPF